MATTAEKIIDQDVLMTQETACGRDAKIAELAFYKAEKRGFEPGHELEDWCEAELEYLSSTPKKSSVTTAVDDSRVMP